MEYMEVTQNLISLREAVNRLDEKVDKNKDTILEKLHAEIAEFGRKVDAVESDLAGMKNWVSILDVKIKAIQWVGTSIAGVLVTSIVGLIWTTIINSQQKAEPYSPAVEQIRRDEPSGIPGRRTGGGTRSESEKTK